MQAAGSETTPEIRRQIAISLFVAAGTAIVIAQWFLAAWSSPQLGWDFPVFYTAGHLPLHLLYSQSAFAAFWSHQLAPLGVPHYSYYMRPAVFSFLLRPMAALPYYHALWLWLAAGLGTYLLSVALLIQKFRLPGYMLPIYVCFFPALAGVIGGTDSSFYFLALMSAFLLLERKQDGWAALALTAGLCKFNLIFLVPVLLLLHRRYRALAYFCLGTVLVAAASVSLLPFTEYIGAVAKGPGKTPGFFPVGLFGFSQAVGQPWSYPILAAAALVTCCWLMRRLPFTEAFCVAIIGALMISPYVCWYDSTLLALPLAVVFARTKMPGRAACVGVLIALPLWLHGGGNNGPIGFMHVGVELLLLAYFFQEGWLQPARRFRAGVPGLERNLL